MVPISHFSVGSARTCSAPRITPTPRGPRLADRLGVAVIDETAAVGLNLGVGGGFFLGVSTRGSADGRDGRVSLPRPIIDVAIEELIALAEQEPPERRAPEPRATSQPRTRPERWDDFAPLFADGAQPRIRAARSGL